MSHIEQTTSCPHCGDQHDAVASVDTVPHVPKNGDASICLRCGQWSVFDNGTAGGLRPPTQGEERWLATDRLCAEVRAAWRQMRKIN